MEQVENKRGDVDMNNVDSKWGFIDKPTKIKTDRIMELDYKEYLYIAKDKLEEVVYCYKELPELNEKGELWQVVEACSSDDALDFLFFEKLSLISSDIIYLTKDLQDKIREYNSKGDINMTENTTQQSTIQPIEQANKAEVKVTLLTNPDLNGIREAGITPYKSTNVKNKDNLVKKIIDTGHISITRHSNICFKLENVSQSLLRQISRHPHLNLTVESTRYCNMENKPVYTPETNIKKIDGSVDEYLKDMGVILDIYKKWKDIEGDTKEADVAKLFLPLASTCDIIVSANIQALIEFLRLRLCTRAEYEIRQVAREMRRLLVESEDTLLSQIFKDAGCMGDVYGICPENHGNCGKYVGRNKAKELLNDK